ncbi:MAG: ABC transporter permease [Alteromonadaceae bacterium]|uniref:FtsX-like permease family protein n=1 Tax=Paraglaciecola mesophila TaxID=197222 RepID=A0ABU9SSE6_9ALTE|nr:ABC transporter permease [Alteromonadaceae bacterium]|tara:strand:- start:9209 stop:10459 length:1251 start_codon:yes stop_codon:yes gene_type:complete
MNEQKERSFFAENWEVGPILRALLRNKVGAILIALQIAFTMTIVVNAIYIIHERSEKMKRPSGIDEANSFYLSSVGFTNDFNTLVTIKEDLNLIRSLEGVVDAIQINAVPMSNSGWSMGLQTQPGAEFDGTGSAVYMVDEHALNTLDVALVAGENFSATDIQTRVASQNHWPDKVIITLAMANRLFPDDGLGALGKTVYINDIEPMIITGIIDKLQAPWVGWDNVENVMLTPEIRDAETSRYFIRTKPGQRDRIMTEVESLLAKSNTGRILRDMRSIDETRVRAYRDNSAMIRILVTVMVILVIVTGLGIVGLASFSVNQRKKQIGTRRALGASQQAIVRYFMLENLLISTVGVVLGAMLTVGLNIVLVDAFSLDPITWYYIPLGMLALWVVGQLAVYGPAKKAANIPPALATRSA